MLLQLLSHHLPLLQRCIDYSPRTHLSMSEWCVSSSPFHNHRSLLCILAQVWSDWLTTVSMKHSDLSLDTLRIAVQVCRAPSALLLESCFLYCWLLGHLSPLTNVVLAPHCIGVWSWGVPSCLMQKLCFLFWPELLSLGCVKGCRCAGYCVADSSQSVRSSRRWDAKDGPVMMGQTAEAALLNMLCCWCGRFTE